MKALLSILAVALCVTCAVTDASAQGKRQKKQDPSQADGAARAEKKKAAEAEYQKALRAIPDSSDKPDPWKGVRSK